MSAARLAPDAAAFYAAQSDVSDPHALAGHYADLPRYPRELARVVRDLMIHRLEGGQFGVEIPEDRLHNDAETRYVDEILRLITARDPAPLTRRREAANRFVGVCRDFTLLHCSLLRHAGIPARPRCGFADYFGIDGFHFDHVVTEYWADDTRGWRLADAQLADPAVTAGLPVDFDPMDVPRDRFLTAGAAWRTIRAGEADPRTFGVAGTPLLGEWFVAGTVRLDLAALNKVETLLWDIWGAGVGSDADMTPEFRDLCDTVAHLTTHEVPFEAARTLFLENTALRTPKTVLSLAPFNGPTHVTLR